MLPPGTTHVQYMYTPFSWIIGLQLCGIETNWIPCNQHVYIVQAPSGNSTCRHIEKHLVIVETSGKSTCRHVEKHLAVPGTVNCVELCGLVQTHVEETSCNSMCRNIK